MRQVHDTKYVHNFRETLFSRNKQLIYEQIYDETVNLWTNLQ